MQSDAYLMLVTVLVGAANVAAAAALSSLFVVTQRLALSLTLLLCDVTVLDLTQLTRLGLLTRRAVSLHAVTLLGSYTHVQGQVTTEVSHILGVTSKVVRVCFTCKGSGGYNLSKRFVIHVNNKEYSRYHVYIVCYLMNLGI